MSSPSKSSPSSETTRVTPPRRFIYTNTDLENFLASPAKAELLRFTGAMGKACSSSSEVTYNPASPLEGLSPPLAALQGMLTQISATWLSDLPPQTSAAIRFGNPAFRDWHGRLCERSTSMVWTLVQIIKEQEEETDEYAISILEAASERGKQAAKTSLENLESTVLDADDRIVVTELCAYLHDAFGHAVRLDYGTGHECSFQVFLLALSKLGAFGATMPALSRLKQITVSIWSAYLKVTRGLQTDYMLEPAGSHGVWGLDDYHCLPFFFGACQLHSNVVDDWMPSTIHDESVLQQEGDRFLYFGCIRYIKSLKKGVPFFEHSPMLNDISQLPSWQKVSGGLLRLFEGEVLQKRQVVQHFVFGEIFKANWEPTQIPKEPPMNTTFRPEAVMGRAPWANNNNIPRAGGPMPPTKAPWAK